MNTLSWLIYLADVVGGFGNIAAIVLFLASVIFCIGLIIRTVIVTTIPTKGKSYGGGVGDDDDAHYQKIYDAEVVGHDKFIKLTSQSLKISGLVFVFMGFLNIVVPSKQTVMMIATSELAESAASSESVSSLAGKSYEALEKFLDSYLVADKD